MEKQTIAICITTRNRPKELRKCIEQHEKHLPKNARIFVVDDASEPPAYRYDCRMVERSGIPRVKNECLKLAIKFGCEHIFLYDDDTYPIADRWELPYINSPYPHLCYSFNSVSNFRLERYGHKAHRPPANGCMMYVHKSVVDRIGGFDTNFGIGKFEHNQFSNRCVSAGLIPYPYIDVVDSDKLIYSMDKYKEVERTMTKEEMKLQSGSKELNNYFNDTAFTDLYIQI